MTPPSPMLEETKVFLESIQPPTDSWRNPPEMFVVSFFPETPGCHQEGFKE